MRGRIYLEDGAIEPWQISADGRHQLAVDERSWHILTVESGSVVGCARYLEHAKGASFDSLEVRHSALAASPQWSGYVKSALNADIQKARQRNLSYVELGGWVLTKDIRFSCEALRVALSTYGLAQILGGVIGVATATVRNHSCQILRKIGGDSLRVGDVELPVYFDPQYKCEMEMLRFDSTSPSPRFLGWIQELMDSLRSVPVIAPERRWSGWHALLDKVELSTVPAHSSPSLAPQPA